MSKFFDPKVFDRWTCAWLSFCLGLALGLMIGMTHDAGAALIAPTSAGVIGGLGSATAGSETGIYEIVRTIVVGLSVLFGLILTVYGYITLTELVRGVGKAGTGSSMGDDRDPDAYDDARSQARAWVRSGDLMPAEYRNCFGESYSPRMKKRRGKSNARFPRGGV